MDIRLFYFYRTIGQLLPVYPVYLLMFQQRGLSLPEISALLIVWSVPGLLLEVPSSILADHWSRKRLMVAGRVLKALCFVTWSFSDGFFGYAAGFVLWGTAGALCSGTEEAWFFDALKAHGREAEFDRLWGKSTFYYTMAVGVVSVLGSIIAAHNMQLTLWLSVLSVIISAIMAAILPEYNFHKQERKGGGFKDYIATLKNGAVFCFMHAGISILVGLNVTVLLTAGILDEYDQLIVRSMGVPLALVGMWGFFRYGMEALGGRVAWKVKQFLKRCGLGTPVAIQLSIGVGAALLLTVTAAIPFLYTLPLYILYYFLLSAGKVLFTDTLQAGIQDQGRATVQSLTAMLETPFGMLIYALFGAVGGFGKLQGSMLAVAGWMVLSCLVFAGIYKMRKGGLVHGQ